MKTGSLLRALLAATVGLNLVFLCTSCDPAGGRGGGGATPAPASGEAAKSETASPAAGSGTTAAANNPAAAPSATIKGKVVYKGAAPAPKKVSAISDHPDCKLVHTPESLPVEDALLVGPGGEFRNILVFVSKGLEGRKFDPPAEEVVFDQKGCMYTPHVFSIMAKQTLKILNSDPLMHNVHLLPKSNKEENRPQPKGSPPITIKFSRPEAQPFRIKCDVHPWMQAWAGVFDHPYHAVSGEDGGFALPKIAPGTYTITAWHEKLGAKTVEVTVADNETKELPAIEFAGS